jgi:hypothetical protein
MKIGDQVKAKGDLITHYADHSVVEVPDGSIGTVVAMWKERNTWIYRVDFPESIYEVAAAWLEVIK